jgi:phospholipase/lecithinase/hemolysin
MFTRTILISSVIFFGLGTLVAMPGIAFAGSGYSDMVVFGDSLSDPGNVFVLTGQVSVRPYAEGNVPSAPYPIGQGKTFSNGPNWSQLVAKTLGLNAGTGPALKNQTFTNYAFGGARASSAAGGPFDMTAQVAQYLADNDGAADPDALYAVWFGGNDVRDALFAFFAGGPPAAQAVITAALSNYATNMGILIAAGAGDVVVLNAPNVGVAPSVTAFGPEASGLATLLSFAFNQGLSDVLDSLEGAFGVNITRVNMFAVITDAVDNPGAYGFANVEDACLIPVVYDGAICKSPDGYLFWDGIHPTRTGHELLADAVLSVLP